MIESVKDLGDGRLRVEPVTCPRCLSDLTRIVDKAQLYCLACGEWSSPYDSPSVRRVIEAEKNREA